MAIRKVISYDKILKALENREHEKCNFDYKNNIFILKIRFQ